MKRLVEHEVVAGSPEELLVDMVRATARAEPSPFGRARILARIHAAKPSRSRVAVRTGIAAFLIAGVAAAAVVAERSLTARRTHPVGYVAVPPAVSESAPVVTAEDEEQASVSTTASAPVEMPVPVTPRSDAKAHPAPKPAIAVVAAAAKNGEDPAPVLEAIRALRSEGDPARAGVLLAAYLKAHPHSVLAEDALALSIESALARHDARAASDLAKRYLVQYPSGRYGVYALRAESP